MTILQIKTPEWFEPVLKPARYKGIHGGRGSGKSHAVAEYIVERCLMQKTDVVCLREVQKSLKQSVKKLIESKIQDLRVGQYFDPLYDRIKTPHGGVIIFEGLANHTAESIKSLEGFDIAWFEEAQSCSQRSLDLLRPTIRKEHSELIFTWNPRLNTDPIDVLLRGNNPPPESIVIEVNFADNPWFPKVLHDEMEYDRGRDPDKYAHIWLGQYLKNSEARVFKNWTIEEFETPADAVLRFGADWGFSVDPTVLVRCHTIGRKLYIDYEAFQVGCEILDTPSLFLSIPESEKWPIVADSSRPETISHMRKNGFPKLMPAVKGAGSLEDGIEWLKSHEIIVHPRCTHVIDELTLYGYKVDELTGNVLPALMDKDNHVIDAIRYALEGVRRTATANKKLENASPVPTANHWGR